VIDSEDAFENVRRGRGPWPSLNTSQAVTRWLHERLSSSDSSNEREVQSVCRLMLDHVSGMGRGERISERWQASESQLEKLSLLAERWCNHEPLQHILHEAHFMGLKLTADSRALIPRPETEELVHGLLDLSSAVSDQPRRFLDVGTGSGCIALAWKSSRPLDYVEGIDLSAIALAQAKSNAASLGFDVHWLEQDVLSVIRDWPARPFDVVASNPPYIPNAEKMTMAENVIGREPHDALFVPDDNPLLFYDRIVSGCASEGWLKQGGWLGFECHRDFTQAVCDLLHSDVWEHVQRKKDLQGNWRMVFARLR
jgi:release factor glutamine methyltransferase